VKGCNAGSGAPLDPVRLLAQSFCQQEESHEPCRSAAGGPRWRAFACPPSAEELVARARALAPKLRERAVKAERDRNISPRISVDEYIDAGLIHTLQPKRWGGYEHDHEVAFDVAVELGKSTCGSSAWCLNYLTDHAAILASFPEQAQHDVWSRDQGRLHRHVGGADRQGVARARRLSPGRPLVVVLGLARHSHWIMIGGLVQRDGDDHPDMRLYPGAGVRGEAGRHLVLAPGCAPAARIPRCSTNVLVPEHRSVSFSTLRDACAPGAKLNTNPIYRTPFIAVHSYALLAPVLGLPAAAMRSSCSGRGSAI